MMRGPLVGRCGLILIRGHRRDPLLQHQQLFAHPHQVFSQLKHRLVLFGHMAFEIGDFLLEMLESLVQCRGSGGGLLIALIFSSSGATTR